MHSRIIELKDRPVSEDERLTVERALVDMDYMDAAVDYMEKSDREGDINWFLEYIEPYGIEHDQQNESVTFLKGFKQRYFNNQFQELQKRINQMHLEDFAEKDGVEVFELKQLVEDTMGFFIYDNDDMPEPCDVFIRNLKEDQPYYFGGTVDYHS